MRCAGFAEGPSRDKRAARRRVGWGSLLSAIPVLAFRRAGVAGLGNLQQEEEEEEWLTLGKETTRKCPTLRAKAGQSGKKSVPEEGSGESLPFFFCLFKLRCPRSVREGLG